MSDDALDPVRCADGIHRYALPDGRRVLAKVRRNVPADFFTAEAKGLAALCGARALRVPQIFAVDATGIVLEDLGAGSAATQDWEHAGARLARLHRCRGEQFGFRTNGYCGDSPQDNTPDDDGWRFFAERRLLPQLRRARDSGLLGSGEVAHVERLCLALREHLPEAPAVLIHGDLWLGNLHACANGELALIDGGAVHYGWAAADLAMLILFGEPPAAFFRAYEAGSGSDSGWRALAPLLNLHHLLNHVNLFGGSYLSAVRGVLRRYA